MHFTFRRLGVAFFALLVVLLLLGVTYQGIATAFERRDYPPPGHLADVGGHQLHLHCTGKGGSSVVLEAPEASLSVHWTLVQDALTSHMRVCSYDRAGLGWSESGGQRFDPARVPDELHAALTREHVPAPYILVGQSMGAALVRLYAGRFPSDVQGLVLLDDPLSGDSATATERAVALGRTLRVAPWLARTGALRLSRLFHAPEPDMPADAAGALASFMLRPDHLTRASHELASWHDIIALARATDLSSTLPVTRIRTGQPDANHVPTRQPGAHAVAAATQALADALRSR